MKTDHQQYLRLLAYCLNEDAEMPDMAGMNWRGLYAFSIQQTIVGIVLAGIDRLSKSQRIDMPQDLLSSGLAVLI